MISVSRVGPVIAAVAVSALLVSGPAYAQTGGTSDADCTATSSTLPTGCPPPEGGSAQTSTSGGSTSGTSGTSTGTSTANSTSSTAGTGTTSTGSGGTSSSSGARGGPDAHPVSSLDSARGGAAHHAHNRDTNLAVGDDTLIDTISGSPSTAPIARDVAALTGLCCCVLQ